MWLLIVCAFISQSLSIWTTSVTSCKVYGACKMRNSQFLLYRNLQKGECHIYHVRFYTANTEKKTCVIHSLSYDRSIALCKTSYPQSAI